MQRKFKIVDNSGDRKYFSMIPHYIVNHSTAYEQSLYLVMKRIAGEDGSCWASPIRVGKMMGVSANTVRKYLSKLEKRGWVKIVGKSGKTKPTNEYEVVDLWELNMQFYAKKESSTDEQSQKESSTGEKKVQLVSLVSSTGGNKEETIKKKQEEDIAETSSAELVSQIIKAFEEVNPASKRFYGNITQRKACKDLLDSFGLDEVLKRVAFLPKSNQLPYFPKINTPLNLWDKWQSLEDSVHRYKSELKAKQPNYII